MKTSRIKFYIATLLIWTILIVSLIFFEFYKIQEEMDNIAKTEARANFNKDQAIRHWAASHGGVYVPIDSTTQPNSALSHIIERDIKTPSGQELTLMNPAYMIRELNNYFAEYYGVVGHLTSKILMRPQNKPDDWELAALNQFEEGIKEVSEYSDIDGETYLRLMQPMVTKQACLKCHAYQGYKVGDIRGGVGISIPMKPILERANHQKKRNIFAFFLIWFIGSSGLTFGYKKVNNSMLKKEQAEQALLLQNSEYEALNEELTVTEEEIRATNEELRVTNEELRTSDEKIREINEELDTKVEQRTKQLQKQNKEYLTLNEKYKTQNQEYISLNEEMKTALSKLKETQSQLVQSEKMASLGVLSAGIAHEINNPINFVYAGINSLLRDFEDIEPVITEISKIKPETEDLKDKLSYIEQLKKDNYFDEAYEAIPEIISDIKLGADRTAEIIKGLRSFSRTDKGELKYLNIHEGIETSLLLLKNKHKNTIEIIKNYETNITPLKCYPGKINQVFLNIISNGIDSIEEKGKIWITTKTESGNIIVSVKDNGCGMNTEMKEKLFDPFYTTKPVGQGTGLGLSITYGIIKEHNGQVKIISEPNQGSEFIVTLPII